MTAAAGYRAGGRAWAWSRYGGPRKERPSVFDSLPGPDRDLPKFEVDVLETKPAAFQQPQAGPIHKEGHDAIEVFQNALDRTPRGDLRDSLWPFRPDQVLEPWQVELQDSPVEEKQCRQRLVRGRGGHAAVIGRVV